MWKFGMSTSNINIAVMPNNYIYRYTYSSLTFQHNENTLNNGHTFYLTEHEGTRPIKYFFENVTAKNHLRISSHSDISKSQKLNKLFFTLSNHMWAYI